MRRIGDGGVAPERRRAALTVGTRARGAITGSNVHGSAFAKRWWLFAQRLRADHALAITEYGMLIALVALALIAVVSIFGGQIASWFAGKAGSITTV